MKIAVVFPCYEVKSHITGVISGIGKEVSGIYVVDDACPESTGKFVSGQIKDKRVKVIVHGLLRHINHPDCRCAQPGRIRS